MGFLQAIFLAGTATFAIPVAIHLIFKLRKQRLVFPSLRFLRESILRESRKLRLRDLILLLLRCAACILIALAFSRPYRPGQLVLGSDGRPRQDLVVVLDDSPSMGAQEATQTRFAQAQAVASRLVQACRSGDRVGLVLVSEPARAEIELAGNFGATLGALQRERPSSLRGDPAAALATAVQLLGESTAPTRRVVLVSDLQANQVDRGAWADLAQRNTAAPRPVAIEILPPDGSDNAPQRLSNLAVTSLRLKSDVWIENHPLRLAVRIENHGDAEVQNVIVRLVAGGLVLQQTTLPGLGPRGSAEIEAAGTLPKPGAVEGYVEIEARDALPEDDRRLFAARLRDSVRAWVVEDQLRKSGAFWDQGYYLRMALDPRPRGGEILPETGGEQSYVRVTAAAVDELAGANLAKADLVFMTGVTRLPPPALVVLEEAVRRGVNLVIFAGRSEGPLDESFYNGDFFKKGEGLLPARVGKLVEGSVAENSAGVVGDFDANHAVFQLFKGELAEELRRPRYQRYCRFDPADLKAGERPAGRVLASFLDGNPFLVERTFGKGRVLAFPFCPRPEHGTDLVKLKVFVPLVHQLVRYLSGVENAAGNGVTVGDTVALTSAGIDPDKTVNLQRPPPLKDVLKLRGSESVTLSEKGTYTATFQRGELTEKAYFAANLDPLESDLNPEDLAVLRNLFASNLEERPAADPGIELKEHSSDELKAQAPEWRYFLVAALLCLLLEVWVRDYWD